MIELYLTLASHHLSHGDFNENNPGVMINYESYIAGGYKNSFSDMSYLVAKKVNWNKGAFDYGLIVGGVTGYDYSWTKNDVTAFAAPYISYDYHGVKPTILILSEPEWKYKRERVMSIRLT